jgi:hypothetical protein
MQPRLSYAALVLVIAAACVVPATPTDPSNTKDTTDRDLAEYDALVTSLEARRSPFLGKVADEVHAAGSRLFWVEYRAFDPTLHSSLGSTLSYSFALGTDNNYGASDDLVVTATRSGDAIVYRAYAANAVATFRGELSLPAPTNAQRWSAYAVGPSAVYIVTTGAATTVLRWVPGSQPTTEIVLEQAGVTVGEFQDVTVFDNRLVFVESGRLWQMPFNTHVPVAAGNHNEVSGGVSADGIGLLYNAADGPYYQAYGGGEPRDIRAEIAASGYALNPTFATMHTYASHAVLTHQKVVYLGQRGLFAYDLKTRKVTPVLLEPRVAVTRITYSDPQILDNQTIYITGLESESGSVGAEGPVYAIEPSALSN